MDNAFHVTNEEFHLYIRMGGTLLEFYYGIKKKKHQTITIFLYGNVDDANVETYGSAKVCRLELNEWIWSKCQEFLSIDDWLIAGSMSKLFSKCFCGKWYLYMKYWKKILYKDVLCLPFLRFLFEKNCTYLIFKISNFASEVLQSLKILCGALWNVTQ